MAKYNVVKDYDWTSSPRGSGLRKTAPRVWVKSYKINSNQVLNRLKGYLSITKDEDAKTFYDKMYGGDNTTPEDDFNFPFFNSDIRSFGNSFGDTFGPSNSLGSGVDAILSEGGGLLGAGASFLGEAATKTIQGVIGGNQSISKKASQISDFFQNANKKNFSTSPGSYIEVPKLYEYDSSSDSALEVSFVLSNTINSDFEKNHNLILRLTYINRPLRKNSIAVDPPRIYQVKVPGHRFIRWAYCSSFSVSLLGTKREIDGVIVPEAYQINMAFQSLTMEHADFLRQAQ